MTGNDAVHSVWRRRRSSPPDGVTLVTLYAVFLFIIPSNYVIGVVGAAGSLAQLTGLAMLGWWTSRQLTRSFRSAPTPQPVRRAAFVFAAAVLASFISAMSRPMDGTEASAANRGLLAIGAWFGVFLVAHDDIGTGARLERLIQRVTQLGSAVAALGVVQFFTKMPFTNFLLLPGLTRNSDAAGIDLSRAGYSRPAGTAIHPIEYGVAVSMLLPLAIHHALTSTNSSKFGRWFPVVAVGFAIPLSVSRSAVICTVVAVTLILPALAPPLRRIVAGAGLTLLTVVYLSIPGMLGTIAKLFTRIGDDNSAASRTDSYGLALEFIRHRPVFGRGFFTFLPEYRILDNQFLLVIIEMGIVGLSALLLLFVVGLLVAQQNRRHSSDLRARQLATALTASLAAGAVSLAFFDAFGFPMVPGLIFVVLGLIGAQHRIGTRTALATGNLRRATHVTVPSSESGSTDSANWAVAQRPDQQPGNVESTTGEDRQQDMQS